jgi:hypothetical protein
MAALPPGIIIVYRQMGGKGVENLAPIGFRSDQLVASSYTEYVILAHKNEMKRKLLFYFVCFQNNHPCGHKLTCCCFRNSSSSGHPLLIKSSRPSLYFLTHFHARVRDTNSFPQTVLNISCVLIAVFPSLKQNFMFVHCPMTTKNTTYAQGCYGCTQFKINFTNPRH